jgi:hypothetical protein
MAKIEKKVQNVTKRVVNSKKTMVDENRQRPTHKTLKCIAF